MICTSCTEIDELIELIINSSCEVVFFDVWHVLATINFRKLNERTIKALWTDYFSYTDFLHTHQKNYYIWKIDTAGFDKAWQQSLSPNQSIWELRTTYYKTHVQLNQELLNSLEEIATTKTVGCISNIFPISRDILQEMWVFDHVTSPIFSCDVWHLKPDPAIFAFTCKSLGVTPSNCLFIDDKLNNLSAAAQQWMHCLHYRF